MRHECHGGAKAFPWWQNFLTNMLMTWRNQLIINLWWRWWSSCPGDERFFFQVFVVVFVAFFHHHNLCQPWDTEGCEKAVCNRSNCVAQSLNDVEISGLDKRSLETGALFHHAVCDRGPFCFRSRTLLQTPGNSAPPLWCHCPAPPPPPCLPACLAAYCSHYIKLAKVVYRASLPGPRIRFMFHPNFVGISFLAYLAPLL